MGGIDAAHSFGRGLTLEIECDTRTEHPGIKLVLGLDRQRIASEPARSGIDEITLRIEGQAKTVVPQWNVDTPLERKAKLVRELEIGHAQRNGCRAGFVIDPQEVGRTRAEIGLRHPQIEVIFGGEGGRYQLTVRNQLRARSEEHTSEL